MYLVLSTLCNIFGMFRFLNSAKRMPNLFRRGLENERKSEKTKKVFRSMNFL